MPVDHGIYGNIQNLDVMGNVKEGMRLKDMMEERSRNSAVKDAYSKNTTVGEDGKVTVNRGGLLSDLAKASPEAMMKQQGQFTEQDRATQELAQKKQMHEMDLVGRIAPNIKDQATYDEGLSWLARNGVDVTSYPKAYDKNLVDRAYLASMSVKEQQDQQLRRDELASRAADRREARDERRFQAGIKMDEKREQLQTPYGLAHSVDDAKKLKEAHEAKKNFDNKLSQMIKLREDAGGGAILDREGVARGKQLSKDLLLEYKNMAKLGVLSQSDEDIINSIIPEDPLQYNSPLAAIQGQDPTLHRLKQFQADSNYDFANRVATRTRGGQPQLAGASDYTDDQRNAAAAELERRRQMKAQNQGGR